MNPILFRINEIFYSIQGEGAHTGLPAIFIRFSGCNLKCTFCDTEHEIYKGMTMDEIIQELKQYPCKTVILTGGEPTLQVDEQFLKSLHHNNYMVHMETNGTIPVLRGVNWLTVSPKENWIVKNGNELKVVYRGQDLKQYDSGHFQYKFLQPCSMENVAETIQVCKENPLWRLSLQTHKMLNIR